MRVLHDALTEHLMAALEASQPVFANFIYNFMPFHMNFYAVFVPLHITFYALLCHKQEKIIL